MSSVSMQWLPRHHYFGPGSHVREEHKPYDRDDEIAQIHDFSYIDDSEHVRENDEQAIDEFWSNWHEDGNVHSLLGGVGLVIKRQIENVYGQQYPMVGHRGRDNYGAALKRLSALYREHKSSNASPLNWWEFQKIHLKDVFKEINVESRGSIESGDTAATSSGKRNDSPSVEEQSANKRARTDVSAAEILQQLPSPDSDSALSNTQIDNLLANMDVDSMVEIANPAEGSSISNS